MLALALCVGASAGLIAGCGGDSGPVSQTTPSTSTARTTATGADGTVSTSTLPVTTATTETAPVTPPASTPSTPTTATPADGTDGGATPEDKPDYNDGGLEPGAAGTPPTGTPAPAPNQDPNCKAGTGPGFPTRPQCEPIGGPDARDEG